MGTTTSVNWTDVVIAVAAFWGAITGTIGLGIQLVQWWQSRRKVNVKIRFGVVGYGPHTSDPMVFLSASNPSEKAVMLSSCGFLLPGRERQLVFTPPYGTVLPCELSPGRGCEVWVEARKVAGSLKREGLSGKLKLVAFYRDQLDAVYKSKPFKFDVEGWAEHS